MVNPEELGDQVHKEGMREKYSGFRRSGGNKRYNIRGN